MFLPAKYETLTIASEQMSNVYSFIKLTNFILEILKV